MKPLRWLKIGYTDILFVSVCVWCPFLYKAPEVSVLVECSAFSDSHCSKVLNLLVLFDGSGPSPSTLPTFNFSRKYSMSLQSTMYSSVCSRVTASRRNSSSCCVRVRPESKWAIMISNPRSTSACPQSLRISSGVISMYLTNGMM